VFGKSARGFPLRRAKVDSSERESKRAKKRVRCKTGCPELGPGKKMGRV